MAELVERTAPAAELAPALSAMDGVIAAVTKPDALEIVVEPAALLPLMAALQTDPRFACEQLMDVAGVDWPARERRFDVVYQLLSVSLNHRVRVIVQTDETVPVPSVSAIWPVATWFERECWDMFGIAFTGQPDLRRILTDYGFAGYPLRKDFPLTGFSEVAYDEERKVVAYQGVSLTQDYRQFDFESPWEGLRTLPGDEKAGGAEGR